MSQRTFSFLFLIVFTIPVTLLAVYRGVIPSLTDLSGQFFTLITPAIFIFTTLLKWYDTLDSKVIADEIKPGDIVPLFTMGDFWITEVACLAGVAQIVGLELLPAETQAVIVNLLLLGATVLLRSFSNRPPQSQMVVGKHPMITLVGKSDEETKAAA